MRRLAVTGLLAVTAWGGGCGDTSGPGERIPAALVGSWRADAACAPPCSFTLTWKQNPQARLDAISLGMALRMEIEAGGRFQFGDVSNMPPAGQVRVTGGQMVVTDAAGVIDTIDYHFAGTALHLDFRREFRVVSFNADTVRDASTAAAVFVRR